MADVGGEDDRLSCAAAEQQMHHGTFCLPAALESAMQACATRCML